MALPVNDDEEDESKKPAPVKTSPDYGKYTAGIAGDTNVKAYEDTHDKATGAMRFDYTSRQYKDPEQWKVSQQPSVNLEDLKKNRIPADHPIQKLRMNRK